MIPFGKYSVGGANTISENLIFLIQLIYKFHSLNFEICVYLVTKLTKL